MLRTFSFFMITAGITGMLAGCGEKREAVAPIQMQPIEFSELDGWRDDRQSEALAAFRQSCAGFEIRSAENQAPLCAAAQAVPPGDPAARTFFETWFTPLIISPSDGSEGLFTGYYEPEIKASRTRTGAYQTPLLGSPPDLITADLGQFDPKFTGERLRGRVADGRLIPYPARSDIERAALAQDNLAALAWVADPVDAFFMHIQGSGRLQLEHGEVLRLAFAEKNGRPYTAIGRVLVDRGALAPDNVSMQTIRAWLAENPRQMPEILAQNQSYIFFRPVPASDPLLGPPASDPLLGPPGAADVPLTPGRSLAVDRAFHILGAPLWLDTQAPSGPGGALTPFRRLMIAQDTGSAIKGPVRGDVFWGSGKAAGEIAGRMQQPGRLVVLRPKQPSAVRSSEAATTPNQ